jgi:uncharacterized protein YfiM (DUF2279 family)
MKFLAVEVLLYIHNACSIANAQSSTQDPYYALLASKKVA